MELDQRTREIVIEKARSNGQLYTEREHNSGLRILFCLGFAMGFLFAVIVIAWLNG